MLIQFISNPLEIQLHHRKFAMKTLFALLFVFFGFTSTGALSAEPMEIQVIGKNSAKIPISQIEVEALSQRFPSVKKIHATIIPYSGSTEVVLLLQTRDGKWRDAHSSFTTRKDYPPRALIASILTDELKK